MDLSIIKMGLEYAQFKDFRVRDALNDLVKNLEADMDDVGFTLSPATIKCIEEFESTLTEIETERAPKPARFEIDERDVEGVREVEPDIEDDAIVHPFKTTNVDDELDEFVQSVKETAPKKQAE